MPKLEFSAIERSRYFTGSVKHKAYNETVNESIKLRVHAEGTYAKELINERRPNESEAVKKYREKIAKAITYPTWGRVVNELGKIRRSAEFYVKYDDGKVPPRIAALPEETLRSYCESNYPFFDSITNWAFSVLLPGYLKDPNAVIGVMPVEFVPNTSNNPETVYRKPFGYWYNSEQVIDFVQDDYAVIKSTDKKIYKNQDGLLTYGDVYFIFTTQYVQRWEQADGLANFNMVEEYPHKIGSLPVFKIQGLFKKSYDNTFIFDSRLNTMVPRLDEALREYSDLQAEVVQNIFSEQWEIVDSECSSCKGTGMIPGAGFQSTDSECKKCNGSGIKSRSPYTKIQIKSGMIGDGNNMPVPPAGYIQKDTSIVKIQDERVDKHEFKALSSINMEYLAQTPLSQSGTAKEVDRDSLNNFVNAVAEDVVAAMDRLYHFVCEYRYNIVLPDPYARKAMLPYINVPEKFDLLSTNYLENKIQKAKDSKVNPIIVVAIEEEYVQKAFAGDERMKQMVLLSLRLDPLSGVSEDDKMVRLSNKGITLETYVLSCNIREFIYQAIDETNGKFLEQSLKEQKDMLMKYARQQIQENSAETAIMSSFPPEKAPVN